MISQKIKDRLLSARKSQDTLKVSFYSTLLGEIDNIGKSKGNRPTTDDEAVAHIRKWVTNVDETMKLRGGVCTELLAEKHMCDEFLPKMMTKDQLESVIKEEIAKSGKNLGVVMKALKENYPNQYNGKDAADIFKEL
jgi:uncharacterized protein YqeY